MEFSVLPLPSGENEYEKIAGARGGEYEGMRVHSVRLPGFVASQEVISVAPTTAIVNSFIVFPPSIYLEFIFSIN